VVLDVGQGWVGVGGGASSAGIEVLSTRLPLPRGVGSVTSRDPRSTGAATGFLPLACRRPSPSFNEVG
jgi:hypothetical protein